MERKSRGGLYYQHQLVIIWFWNGEYTWRRVRKKLFTKHCQSAGLCITKETFRCFLRILQEKYFNNRELYSDVCPIKRIRPITFVIYNANEPRLLITDIPLLSLAERYGIITLVSRANELHWRVRQVFAGSLRLNGWSNLSIAMKAKSASDLRQWTPHCSFVQ